MQKVALTAGISLLFSLLMIQQAKAANFTFSPTVTFEVIDGGFSSEFDGLGDEVFPNNFDTVVLGPQGESAEFAEFDLAEFSLPPLQVITSAIFQAEISTIQTTGLGILPGNPPNSLGVFGYIGNGEVDASDLQESTLLNTIDTSTVVGGEVIDFDVTSFVQNLVSNDDRFVGLAIRAQDQGALTLGGSNFSGITPRLIIKTASVPESANIFGLLAFGALGVTGMIKRSIRR
ncbi:PEP-CTERM sorting domain-containing protein [Nodularia harveyana UHCC-0300]|uniref:PEP-CTERM sorting domain-containing protein n=1 Tax=Nodularia harveyana UHCC-0300 TaxID=2974287 RepID=A0ABU5UGY4_9CYAN|nr:PEP-CTERM sorting domain-containing protein [Nodularia harveyana]MEA5582598.1 PEP-CTERM sorting domain-containing protein [Nodularia harveyana UHCC-0300]